MFVPGITKKDREQDRDKNTFNFCQHSGYHRLLNRAQEGLFISTTEEILFVNRSLCSLLDFEERELKDMHPGELIDQSDRPAVQSWMDRLQQQKAQTVEYELNLLCRNGQKIPCEVDVQALKQADVWLLHGCIRDLSYIKALHSQLELMREMMATVAHEVRNPMTTIRGLAQMLALEDTAHQHEYDLMLEELDRAVQLLSGALNMSGERAAREDRLDIHELLTRCLDSLAGQLSCSEIELVTDFDDWYPVYVYANENKLKQAFFNICHNALEAMYTGGRMQIVTRVELDRISLMFRDNGRGIPRELMEEICTPFFTTKESGTGLGLSICSRIIRAYGGQFNIESQLNQGTVVTVTLPISRT